MMKRIPLRHAKGRFDPSGRNYGNDHILDVTGIAIEIPNDREKVVIKTDAVSDPLRFFYIKPGLYHLQQIILENGNPVASARPVVFGHYDAGVDGQNINLAFDGAVAGDPDNGFLDLQPLENMLVQWDAPSETWDVISLPIEVDGGSFV